jgi:hypothetical protein
MCQEGQQGLQAACGGGVFLQGRSLSSGYVIFLFIKVPVCLEAV